MGCSCRFGPRCGFCTSREQERWTEAALRREEGQLDEEIALYELRLAVQKAVTVQERLAAKRAYLNKLKQAVK